MTRARFLNPQGEDLDVDLGSGAVVDRKRFGEVLLEEADRAGAEIHYDTVVTDVRQDEAVHGVTAVEKGTPKKYDAGIVIDAAGALSVLQDKTDLGEATFDTNVNYQQFCSAYREIIETNDPVDYEDAIVFKPTAELGYLWYFPRSAHEINVGVGFQMNKSPMKLVQALREDVRQRPEFEGATVRDKLGAALPTRRPYDSGTAPGYIAVGDAAAHVNPVHRRRYSGCSEGRPLGWNVAVESIGEGPRMRKRHCGVQLQGADGLRRALRRDGPLPISAVASTTSITSSTSVSYDCRASSSPRQSARRERPRWASG
ncbi:MAG: tryptophan 7-halogenase [Halobacteriales archaeon]|nr:tryptophan 7-halogenase [Halobacteriales archaeon]